MTKLTNIKNDIPNYAEQKLIQTDLLAQDILKTNIVVPSNFIQLETRSKNYMCSTQG
jgi:hypothetical protein